MGMMAAIARAKTIGDGIPRLVQLLDDPETAIRY
jgi:hypothetical protein